MVETSPIPDLFEQVPCNYCGSTESKVIYDGTLDIPDVAALTALFHPTVSENVQIGRVVECKKCGLWYTNPRLRAKTLLDAYGQVEDPLYLEEEPFKRLSAKRNLGRIARHTKPPGDFLDVGCFLSFFIDEARLAGWTVQGVEPSRWAVNFAVNTLHLPVKQGFLPDQNFPENSFDVLTMYQVFEHLPDPMAQLAECFRVLRPGGLLVIDIPIVDSFFARVMGKHWWFFKDMHTYHYTRESVRKMLTKQGFQWESVEYGVKTCGAPFLVTRIKPYSQLLYRAFESGMKKFHLEKRAFHIALGDIVTIYARKPK